MRRLINISFFVGLFCLLFAVSAVTVAYQALHTPTDDGRSATVPAMLERQSALALTANEVSITDNGFVPAVITVTLGTEVSWINNGTGPHVVASPTPEEVTTPPVAPTGLSATAGDSHVTLDWNDNGETDLSAYRVYRSTTSGEPYNLLANNLTPSMYVDSSVSNGTVYFYVVTAVDSSDNESDNSDEASAMPVADDDSEYVYLPLLLKAPRVTGFTGLATASQLWGSANLVAASHDAWSSGLLLQGAKYSRAFNSIGTFDYLNSVHPEMTGQVVVVPANETPTIQITSPVMGAVTGPGSVQVSGTIADDGNGFAVKVNGLDAQVSGNSFEATISLPAGNQTIQADVYDSQGLANSASVVVYVDGEPPEIDIDSPKNDQAVYEFLPEVVATFGDFGSDVDANSVTVALQQQGQSAVDISASMVITSSGLAGVVPGALTADSVYTLTFELDDQFGNQASQAVTFYVPAEADAIQPPVPTSNSGWVSGRVYDSSTCDLDLIACQGLTGAQVTLETVDTGLLATLRQQRQDRVLSRLISDSSFSPLEPLETSLATTTVMGTVISGPGGFFAFPADMTGSYWLRAEKSGFTYAQRQIDIVRERSTATNAIYLTPEDSAVTSCDSNGCNHTNSNDTLKLDIPAGAITNGDSVDLRATWFSNVEFLPSGELPPATWETYAFDLSAGQEITFTTPVTVQVRNERGFSSGTPIPVGYWNQFTQEWEHVGISTVDITGDWLVFTTTHFSPFDTNIPVYPPEASLEIPEEEDDPNNPDPSSGDPASKKGEPCTAGTSGCFVGLKTGVLQEWINLPPTVILGEPESPQMRYSTDRAFRSQLIDARVSLSNIGSSFLKDYMTFELYIEGTKTEVQHIPIITSTVGELGRIRYMWDGVDAQGNPMPPGTYHYQVKFIIPYTAEYCRTVENVFGAPGECSVGTGVYTDGEIELQRTGTIILDSEEDGPFGEGWVLDGHQRLYENERGDIVIMDGKRHDEFYFPQKDLLAPITPTQSAAASFSQLSGSLTNESAGNDAVEEEVRESRNLNQPTRHEQLPTVEVQHPENLPQYSADYSEVILETAVCGSLTGDTTWDIAGSPYAVTCDVSVESGASLTIDPGVAVQFQDDTSLFVAGTMVASGTSGQPVTFQAETGSRPGTWRQIAFLTGSSGDLSYVVVEHGGNIPNSASLGAVTVNSSLVRIENSLFQENQTALFISNASPVISQTTFYSNTSTRGGAIYLQNDAAPSITGNTFELNQANFDGGAIYGQNSSPLISASDFYTNSASNNGGAIFHSYGTIHLQDNQFSGNHIASGFGGAVLMYNFDEASTVISNTFQLNYTENGGGGALYNESYNNLILDNTFTENSAWGGGAIDHYDYYDQPESTLFSGNLFQDNVASFSGGGLNVGEGDPWLSNNIFVNNSAQFGGGLFTRGGPYLQHNVFTLNEAQYGGALAHEATDGLPHLSNNIILSNTATTSGGGLYNGPLFPLVSFGDYNLYWANTPSDYTALQPGPHDIQADPLLTNPQALDFHLLPGSPAIDAGSWDIFSNEDWEGDQRPMGSSPDIGLDEANAFGVNIQEFPTSAAPGEIVEYAISAVNPDISPLNVVLSHTLPSDSDFNSAQGAGWSCSHDGASLGGVVDCTASLLAQSQSSFTVTVQMDANLPAPTLQRPTTSAQADAQNAQDQSSGWLEWCRIKVNNDPVVTDLEDALGDSNDGDLVKVSGRCTPRETLRLFDDYILQGGWDKDFVTRDPEVFVTTIEGAYTGGILETSDSPTVEGLHLVHAVDINNGAVNLDGGAAVIQDNVIAYNVGSGIYTWEDQDPAVFHRILSNTIHNNVSDEGGGIYSRSYYGIIRDNWIYANAVSGYHGGGINIDRAGNFQNNILQNNSTEGNGGGLYFNGWQFDPVSIEYNVMVGNQADLGGGMAIFGSLFHSQSVFRNNIVANNSANTTGGMYQETEFEGSRFNNLWNNINGDFSGSPTPPTYLFADPLFEDPDTGDFHLKADSPMIDRGDPLGSFIPDREGDPRPLGARVDIGVDEYRSFSAYSRTSTDYSRLDYDLVSESYVRIYPDQTIVVFDSQNRHDFTLAPDGKKTSYAYRLDGNLASVSITAPGEQTPSWVWTFNYASGRLQSITDPAGRVMEITINDANHLTQVIYPDNSDRQFFYDSLGLLTHQQDANGNLSDYSYDRYGRNRTILYPVRSVYDPQSDASSLIRETRVITPSDTAFVLLNDRLPGSPSVPGDPVPLSTDIVDEIQFARGGLSASTDRWGFTVSETDDLGRTTRIKRFSSGLPTQKTFPDGDCVEFEYNRKGTIIQETAMPEDQCDLEEDQRDENKLKVWEYSREDRFNQVKTETDPEGRVTTYIYDYETAISEFGKVIQIIYPEVDNGQGVLDQPSRHFTYNQWGLIETETDPMGAVTRYRYTQGTPDEAAGGADPHFKPGVEPVPGLLADVIQDEGGENLTTSYRDYDSAGNPGKIVAPGGFNVTTYLYDEMNRTVQVTDAVGVVTTYAYDGNGNQIERIVDPGGMNVVTSRTYDANEQAVYEETNDGLTVVSQSTLYDINRMPAVEINDRGARTVYRYDEADQLVNRIDPGGHIYTYTYAIDGNLKTVQDPSGSITRFVYDDYDRQIEEIIDDNVLALSTSIEYNRVGNAIAHEAPDGRRTCFQYDGLDRIVAEIRDCDGLRLTNTFTYDLNGNLLSETNYRNVTSSREYDSLNRLLKEVLDDGGLSLIAERSYDATGNLEKAIDHRGTESAFSYDALNRVVEICRDLTGLNQCQQYTFDALGNTASVTDGQGTLIRNLYNGFSRLVEKVEDANGLARTTRYTYDNALNLTSMTDDNGNATHYQYDLRDQQILKRFADGTAVTSTYDGRGLQLSSIDQEGITTVNAYDGAGRQVSRNVIGQGTQSFAYDALGRVISANGSLSAYTSTVAIQYDLLSNIIGIDETVGGNSWQTLYEYDYGGGVYTITYPSGAARSYTLDQLNRPDLIQTDGGDTVASFTFADIAGEVGLTYGNGVTETVFLDPLFRPERIGSSLADYRFGYDGANNRTYRQRTDLPGQPAEVYQYNSLYQITKAWYGADDTNPVGISNADRVVIYEQDTLSNRLSVDDNGVSEAYGPMLGSALSNPMNRYETVGGQSYTYNLRGDLVDDGVFAYSYDGLSRLVEADSADTTARYIYNALNWRVAKVVTATNKTEITYFVHDVSGQVLEERDGDDNLLARFTYDQGIDRPLTMERGGLTYYYNRDPQGSITQISDESGQLVEQINYDIYGEAFITDNLGTALSNSAIGNPYFYTARRLDNETGKYYFRGRMYDPETGRFMQMDPIGYLDGMNLYASYFAVNGIDPSGLAVLFTKSEKSGAWYWSLTVSLEDSKKSCCKEGVTVADGDRELGLKLKVEAGLGADVKGWIKGQNILGGSVKGPRASGTASLSMKNKNCGGPFDTAEICNTQVLFAGASADAKITAPTPESMKKFDSSTGLFSGADPIVKKLNIGAAVTVGLQGTLTNCAAFDFRNFSLKSTFCGESVITASVTFLDTGKSTWQPFQENFRKFCITLLDEAIPVPPILLP